MTRIATTAMVLALALLVSASALAAPCAEVFDRLYPDANNPTVRYVQGEAGNDITYGLEGELKVSTSPGLLEWYRPSNKTDDQWFAMTQEQRISAAGRGSGMVKTGRAPAWLHESLSSDPGGAEFMTKPTAKLEEAMSWVATVERQLGQDQHGRSKVYWQGNVAYKREGDFSRTNRDGIMGYVKATGDYAQFGKLHKGYEVHQRNPDFVPGKNLGHANLPPVNTDHVQKMAGELTAAGERRRNNGYSHYIQGTFFRTWPYPDRNGFEVRDAHKDVKVLGREMKRLTHGLERGFASYVSFKNMTMTDETAHFNKYSEAVKTMLNKLSHSKRYALPMRPFEAEYPTALGLQGQAADAFRTRVTTARNSFVQTMEGLAGQQGLSKDQLTNKVRVALGKFAHQSGIYTALDGHFSAIGGR